MLAIPLAGAIGPARLASVDGDPDRAQEAP